MTLLKQTALLALSILAVAELSTAQDICSRPDVFFCSGFEGAGTDINKNWQSPYPGYMTEEAPGPFDTDSNHILRMPLNTTRKIVTAFDPGYDTVYARWYQQWEAGTDFSKMHHHGGVLGTGAVSAGTAPRGCDAYRVTVDTKLNSMTVPRSFMYAYFVGMSGGWGNEMPSQTQGAPVEDGRWYCMELMVDLGTPAPTPTNADGIMSFWVDGKLYGPYENLWLRVCPTLKTSYFELETYVPSTTPEDKQDTGLLFDDVVLGTERIGCTDRVAKPAGSAIGQPNTAPRRASPFEFQTSRRLSYRLSATMQIRMRVHGANGRLVQTLHDGTQEPGAYNIDWDGKNVAGVLQPAGVFLLEVEAQGRSYSRGMLLMR